MAQDYSENKILIEYEIFGCGSLVVRVIKGGDNMASLLRAEYPNIATDEVRFTKDSDEPYLHLNSAEFWTAGLARGYNYIMEGEVVGATKGAMNCCAEDENDVAYNAIVPEFRVDRWYTANYMPYYNYGNGFVALFWICGVIFCLAGTVFTIIKKGNKRNPNMQGLANQADSTVERRSMTQKQIAGWLIEFDKDATKLAYMALPPGIGCTCHTCRNFDAAIPKFPDIVCSFFEELGVDLAKPSEVYENIFENNHVLYGGFYHIVGNYLSGDDIWQPAVKKRRHQTTEFFRIADGFKIGFTQVTALVPDSFPQPVLQMEIRFLLPWVLDEPYEN